MVAVYKSGDALWEDLLFEKQCEMSLDPPCRGPLSSRLAILRVSVSPLVWPKHFTLSPRSALSWAASRTTHDLYLVASCRFNGGSRLLDACSLSSNLNSGEHNDFILIPWNPQCRAEPIRHALRPVGSRRSAARLDLRRQRRCDSASVLIVCSAVQTPTGLTPVWCTLNSLFVPASRVIA